LSLFYRKIPVRRRSKSPVSGTFRNKLSEEGKECSNLKDDNICQVMMHDDLNEAISQNNQILPNLIIRELNSNHMKNSENVVLDNDITNKSAVVLYKEPVNLVNQLIKEASEDDMDVEQL